ncbi:MAG: hypothetical protein U1E65_00900 [Myxococcota bacterium]
MSHHSVARLGLATFLLSAAGLLGCEGDVLAPTNGFKPSECLNAVNCDNGGDILDAGLLVDTGLPATDIDSGNPNGGADSGVGPQVDAGVGVDTGVVDPPDSGAPVDAGPPPDFLNLSGTHDTVYHLDLSDYLLGIANIAGPLDTIDQALQGNVNTGIPPLDALIAGVLQQYIPPWVQTVVHVLNEIANFFEEVDVTGVMNIAQDLPMGNISAIHATETWQTLTVYLIDQCPRGRSDPGYPGCARRMISVVQRGRTGVGPLDVEVDVHPFDGVLQPGRPEADFMFNRRKVDMDLYKLVTIMINLALNLATNGQIPNLQAGLNQLIDCSALQSAAYNFATGTLGLGPIPATAAALAVLNGCNRTRQNVIDAITNGLNSIGLSIVSFDFDQHGHAIDTNGNHRPETLQVITTPNTLDGDFEVLIGANMGGVWSGINRNP